MADRVSRSTSRRRIVSRLSCACLPARETARTLTRPFLKYIWSGTSVSPFSAVRPINFRISCAMQQELPLPHLRMVGVAAMAVGADVHVHHPHLAAVGPRVAVAEVDAPFADGLDLGAEQRDARLLGLEDVVVVAGFAIVGDDRCAFSRSSFSTTAQRLYSTQRRLRGAPGGECEPLRAPAMASSHADVTSGCRRQRCLRGPICTDGCDRKRSFRDVRARPPGALRRLAGSRLRRSWGFRLPISYRRRQPRCAARRCSSTSCSASCCWR